MLFIIWAHFIHFKFLLFFIIQLQTVAQFNQSFNFLKDIVLYIRTWDHRMYGNLHQSLELSVQLIQSSY